MPKRWLEERWVTLLPAIEAAGGDEQTIKALCASEIDAWRERPDIVSPNALRKPMTDTRNALRTLPVTETNSHVHPRTGKREHLALKYLNFSEAEWKAMDAPSKKALQERELKLIEQPDAIVEKAITLLLSQRWEEIAVALAVTTGRRFNEVLTSGHFLPKTRYTVIFAGQLKRRDVALDPYEIPTLAPANLVLEAWQRLRKMVDCRKMDLDAITVKYGPAVKEAAERHFSDLVSLRTGRQSIYVHLMRSIYARIAVFWYCPLDELDLNYMSTIQGHYWDMDESGELKPDHVATLHYYDYRIGDGSGHIDGRQGIKLGEPGVKVLEVYQKKAEAKAMTREPHEMQKQEKSLQVKPASKTGYSILKPKQQTRSLIDQIRAEEGLQSQDEVLLLLVKEHYQLKQLSNGPELVELFDELKGEGVENPTIYLREMVQHERNFKVGLSKRYQGLDYSSMSLDQLSRTKTPEAANERFRRAVQAIMAYNRQQPQESLTRWYINQSTISALVGGRKTAIGAYLEAHRQEIDQHHQELGITPNFNRKPVNIEDMISVPEALA